MNGKNSIFGIGLLAGVVVGLAVGILYAPRPGRETREQIREKASDVRDKAAQIIEDAKEKAEEIIQKAKSTAAQIRGRKGEVIAEAGGSASK